MSHLPPSPPQREFDERRRHLRQQRRWQTLRRTWQFLMLVGFAWGGSWLMTRPGWVVHDATSIQVNGAVFLSPEAVRSHLPIEYPQALFHIPTHDLERHLQALGPIADASIKRHLFPPRLTVYIQEYHPVAILVGHSYSDIDAELYDLDSIQSTTLPQNTLLQNTLPQDHAGATGFVDENGTWLPLGSYDDMDEGLEELPTLEVIGMRRDYQAQWKTLYRQVNRSPVEVEQIDWRQLDNLILKTELGITHHGSYNEQIFMRQLQRIDEMRKVGGRLNLNDVSYFDLRSPDDPLIQYKTGASTTLNPESTE